jgi:peptidoglycan hydrolase-like protein with peptidoglycan-binding domain
MTRHGLLTASVAAAVAVGASSAALAQEPAGGAILTYTQALAPDAIRLIQSRLHDAGLFQGAVDGVWNTDSAQALSSFQRTRGLQVTGQVNLATAVTLGINPAPPPAPAPTPQAVPRRAPVALSPVALRQVQIRLREGGYYTGAVDGVWGPGSQAALVRMQQTRGLPVTGRIDPASVQALGFDPNTFPSP